MSTTLKHPGEFDELDDHTRAILTERLRTADDDAKTARDARVVIAELRKKLTANSSSPK